MLQDSIVIVSAARTPMGNLLGDFRETSAIELGGHVIRHVVEHANLPPETLPDAVLMGCVLPAGLGQAPARQAAIHAKLPTHIGATTINKMCGSGMQAVMLAHDTLLANTHHIIVAGGMENMTQAPHLLLRSRQGYRLGHQTLKDHMFLDGLEDAYDKGKLMGFFADATAMHYQISRQSQDAFAMTSLQRAQKATEDGTFAREIVAIPTCINKTEKYIEHDEQPLKANLEKIPTLKPAFSPTGTVTAANASSISDGAAALLLMKHSTAEKFALQPIARIVAHATHAEEPAWFTRAPIGAIGKLLQKTAWSVADVDLFEINEAFAVVALVAMQQLKLPHEKVNIHGGACALGHPIGASGARIIVSLLNALDKYQQKRGIAAICIGGGEATAIAIERC